MAAALSCYFMQRLSKTCEAIAGTTKKLVKTSLVSEYFRSCPVDGRQCRRYFFRAARFLSGKRRHCRLADAGCGGLSRNLRVRKRLKSRPPTGGSAIWERLQEKCFRRTGRSRHRGVGGEKLPFGGLLLYAGPAEKAAIVRDLLSRATPLEAKYIVKIMTGDLRIGLKESLVEEAIAKAYGSTLAEVQRANMLLGDIGATLRLAAESKLGEAQDATVSSAGIHAGESG